MTIDDSELRGLIRHIEGAPVRVMKNAEAVAKRAMQNIKNDLVADAKTSLHFWQVGPTISYDERHHLRGVDYEIGPDKDRYVAPKRTRKKPGPGTPGDLANIAYFGGANGGGGTLDFDGPIEKEIPRLEKYLADALKDAL